MACGSRSSRARTATSRPFTPWDESPVRRERQIRGLDSARLWERELRADDVVPDRACSASSPSAREDGWHRYGVAGAVGGIRRRAGNAVDAPRARWGVGSIHHLAWRVDDDGHQMAVANEIDAAGRRPTPVIDRFWFQSVYFLEPGGVLFELATDGPGFAVDEDPAHLGESLVLPPWLESNRSQIASVLPQLQMPSPVARSCRGSDTGQTRV